MDKARRLEELSRMLQGNLSALRDLEYRWSGCSSEREDLAFLQQNIEQVLYRMLQVAKEPTVAPKLPGEAAPVTVAGTETKES
jgi:hypothetical protein